MSLDSQQPTPLDPQVHSSSRVPAPQSIMFQSPSNQTAMATSLTPNPLAPAFRSAPGSTTSSPSIDGSFPQTPPTTVPDPQSSNGDLSASPPNGLGPLADVDPQIVEALKGKDRIYVLKLGESMEGLINVHGTRLELQPSTSYQRMLIHRCSAFYKLVPESDPVTKAICVRLTPDSRIPARRLSELVPAEPTSQPAFKIMRRSIHDRRSKPQSHGGSIAGEDADLSDVEPSEAGSLGGRSASSRAKQPSIEEREAAYKEARSRIFMGFDEKGNKEKDMSASSSSLSLASGSSTNGGGGSSSVGDLDDNSSSPATESEWSGPSVPREKEMKRNLNSVSAGPSSRSLRSSAPTFHSNGSGSSRNSRAGSPTPTFATLYEPPPQPTYEHPHHPGLQPHAYPHGPYMYPYPPPAQPLNSPPYHMGYYGAYNGYPPHPPHSNNPESQLVQSPEMYPPHPPPPPHMGYNGSYGWPHPSQSPVQQHTQVPHQGPNHSINPPPPPNHIPQYPPFIPPSHQYPYPMPGYYPPPPGQTFHPHPPLPHGPPQPMYDIPNGMNVSHNNPNTPTRMGLGNGVIPPTPGRTNSRNTMPMSTNNGSKPRGGGPVPPHQPRAPWSYGPGIGGGGHGYNAGPGSSSGGDIVGPRMMTKRPPYNGGSTTNRPSNGDDVSSTASSSTTSSSSRRTYTSTSSSQHPLPPRPDWAVGLRPGSNSNFYSPHGRHQDHANSRKMSPISPPRSLSGGSRQSQVQSPPVSLQATDFPPLTSVAAAPEKRTPVVAGAWGNPPARSILLSPGMPAGTNPQHPSGNGVNPTRARLEDSDHGFERPPPKSVELFNPKSARRPQTNNGTSKPFSDRDQERFKPDAVAAAFVGQIASMTLEDQDSNASSAAVPSRESSALAMAT